MNTSIIGFGGLTNFVRNPLDDGKRVKLFVLVCFYTCFLVSGWGCARLRCPHSAFESTF